MQRYAGAQPISAGVVTRQPRIPDQPQRERGTYMRRVYSLFIILPVCCVFISGCYSHQSWQLYEGDPKSFDQVAIIKLPQWIEITKIKAEERAWSEPDKLLNDEWAFYDEIHVAPGQYVFSMRYDDALNYGWLGSYSGDLKAGKVYSFYCRIVKVTPEFRYGPAIRGSCQVIEVGDNSEFSQGIPEQWDELSRLGFRQWPKLSLPTKRVSSTPLEK